MTLARVLGVAALLLLAGIACYLSPLKPGIIALQFAFTQSSFETVLHAWHPEGVRLYRSRAARVAAAWLLPLAALCDALENVLHLHLTAGRGDVPALLFAGAVICATLKWALLGAFLAIAVHARVTRTLARLPGSAK